jgi:hypothetical protein
MGYPGKERRRRFVYLTRNTEYHTHDGVCVAVRDRRTGAWSSSHPALKRRIEGGVRTLTNGCALPTLHPPQVGAPMYFVLATGDEDSQLVTSRIESIDRPEWHDVARYSSVAARQRSPQAEQSSAADGEPSSRAEGQPASRAAAPRPHVAHSGSRR